MQTKYKKREDKKRKRRREREKEREREKCARTYIHLYICKLIEHSEDEIVYEVIASKDLLVEKKIKKRWYRKLFRNFVS